VVRISGERTNSDLKPTTVYEDTLFLCSRCQRFEIETSQAHIGCREHLAE
jgi:hypothetical protein